eukprot:TRINITY_DN16892_c0_g1_i1.p1 TRINITY_DN16892_c0_g1~~TRINITY_DN16892_c0_g1_i1.p1  ORF type:complete len:223 (+),score=74.10 TRINITY_DN16892_c0_g1_i1:64-669(+)
MSGNFFRGTSTDQVKCVNADAKLVKKLQKDGKFPAHYSKKVDMAKVSMDVMKPWIAKRCEQLLGFEDDIVVDFCIGSLENPPEKGLCPKMLQVNMTGFMERKAAPFCSELWKHLLSAQESPVGVPQEFIEQKKEDLRQKKEEAERVQDELKKRRKELEEEAARASGATKRDSGDSQRDKGGRRERDPSGSRSPPRRKRRFD